MIVLLLFGLSFFFLLFSFYYLIRDDLYFLRKGVTLEQLFNTLFFGIIISFFSAKLLYAIFHPQLSYLNPITTLLIPYFSKISIIHWVFGFLIVIPFLTKKSKIHTTRYLDYVSIALLSGLAPATFAYYLLQPDRYLLQLLYSPVSYLVLFFFFIKVLFPKFLRGSLKEGSITLLFLVMVSLVSLLEDIILLFGWNILLQTEDIIFTGIFFGASLLLIRLQTKRIGKAS